MNYEPACLQSSANALLDEMDRKFHRFQPSMFAFFDERVDPLNGLETRASAFAQTVKGLKTVVVQAITVLQSMKTRP